MKKRSLIVLFLLSAVIAFSFVSSQKKNLHPAISQTQPTIPTSQKIQVAILLDVSNSMDGLIEQAKAQLWNMASVMGKAKCGNDVAPKIEIALYEYGRTSNDIKKGFVKQISSFTNDLDSISKLLFELNTEGGDEYCGQVMFTSLKELKWDTASNNYKVIFIAGNEDFLQGKLSYTAACTEAKKKGVIVNTIYCGDKMAGISEHWNIVGECGTGSYTNINQDATLDDIVTPYDSILFSLNERLNGTYISYGYAGRSNQLKQTRADQLNYQMNRSVAAKRVQVKAKKSLYKNEHWDLVDAESSDSTFINKVDLKTLPDSLRTKSRIQLKQIVDDKNHERETVQEEITNVSTKREEYIKNEKKKNAAATNNATLETEIEKIIKKQAGLFGMRIESL